MFGQLTYLTMKQLLADSATTLQIILLFGGIIAQELDLGSGSDASAWKW